MTLSPIFEFADRFVAEQSELDPCLATSRGIPGHDDRLTDYSPEGHESRAKHMRLALTELGQLTPADIAGLFGIRQPVTESQIVLAKRAWRAFRPCSNAAFA